MRRKMKKIVLLVIINIIVTLGFTGFASATCPAGAQTCSTSYQVNQAFFGSGGALNDCSATYCAKEAAGEIAAGNTKGTAFQAQAGFNTDRNPYLQVFVNTSSINMGILSSGSPKTATATFSVKDYLSSGYEVLTESQPPKSGSYTLHNLSSATTSSVGTEQFGMNLVANNSCGGGLPGSLGVVQSKIPAVVLATAPPSPAIIPVVNLSTITVTK